MNRFKRTLREITQYPSALAGLLIILFLVAVSIVTTIIIPYNEAIRLWRGGEDVWYNSPKTASPIWVNWFRREKLPESFTLDTREGEIEKTYETSGDTTDITFTYTFDFEYDVFPDELSLVFHAKYAEKFPYVSLTWLTPDGREIRMSSVTIDKSQLHYRISQDDRLQRKLGGLYPQIGLFADPNFEEPTPLRGTYQLQANALVFEPESDVDA